MPDLLRKIFLSSENPEPRLTRSGAVATATGGDLEQAWRTAPVALALVDRNRVGFWNDACRILLREAVGESELACRRWLVAAVARLAASGRRREVLAGAGDALSLEVRLGPEKPGRQEWSVTLRGVRSDGRQEDDLAETVSTLSHELRTPLTSMKSSLSLVLAGESGPVTPEQAHFLGMTMRNINRLERLVSDLLDVSRTRAGETVLYRRETDLVPILREATLSQEAAARHAGLELDVSGLPTRLVAHVDPDKVVQILTNIVGNSIKYTRRGGLVRVWTEARPRFEPGREPDLAWLLAEKFMLPLHAFNLVVEDSGVGMSRADQDRVFEPWFRGGDDAPAGIPGSGLGLHITRALVEAHGGSIRLASEPGQGTTVWVRLPRDSASEQLLHAARQLRALARNQPTQAIAVLDGRETVGKVIAAGPLAHAFLRYWASTQPLDPPAKIVTLAPGLVATVAADPATWQAVWAEFQAPDTGQTAAPDWQFISWPALGANNESMSRPLRRNV
jgi:signal transduction histidine kinase